MTKDKKTIDGCMVRQSNQLIEASYNLTANENKLIRLVASMVRPEDKEFKEYEFKIADLLKYFGVKDQNKYIEIPKMTKELMKKVFTIKEGNTYTQLSWFCSTKYKTGEGVVCFKFAPDLQKFFLDLTSNYTQYQLINVLRFKSTYSFRFYELLKQYEAEKMTTREFEINELRWHLGITDDLYKQYGDFKKRVVLPAQQELADKTDILFDFDEIKECKKVCKIRFFISLNKNNNVATGEQFDETVHKLVEDFKKLYKQELNIYRAARMIELKGLDKVYFYLDNLKKFIKNDDNLGGLFYKAVTQEWKIPERKSLQPCNFEQRPFTEEELEQFYEKTV
jgi:plasmid replication initiation protein